MSMRNAVIHRQQTQAFGAQPKQLDGLLDGAVRLARRVEHQPLPAILQPLAAHIEAGLHIARDREGHQVRHRPAAHQQAARLRGKAEHLLRPVEHLPLDVDAHVLAAAHVRVETGRQHLGQHPQRGAVPHHPAPEARMHVAHRIRQDVGAKILVDRLRRLALQRQRLLQVSLHLRRHRLPDLPLPHGFQPGQHVIHHAMPQAAHRLPILGVECLFVGVHKKIHPRPPTTL